MIHRQALPCFAWLGFACFASAYGQPAFEAQVKSHVDAGDFIGSVLVAKDGKALYRTAVGMAQAEWDIPNTPETKFRLGSITKQFTAVAILQLVEQGKIRLEDPVKKYYEDAPAAWDAITIHHLLNHTSGIPSYTSLPDFFPKQSMAPLKPAEIVKLTQDKPLQFVPGAQYRYNNTGYVLLGAILEKVTGKSYADHLRDVIFTPLDMKDTGYDVASTILKNRAAGYQRAPSGRANARYLDMTLPHAAGALYSTVDDLLKWDQALYTEKLISAASRDKMFTPGLEEYGYGWSMQKLGSYTTTQHGGGINGFSTHILRIPSEKLLVVTLANLSTPGASKLANELARLALGIPLPQPLKEISIAPEKLQDYPGVYPLTPQFALTVRHQNNQMFVQGTGQGPLRALPYEPDKFFSREADAQIEFLRGPDGKVNALILHQNGRDQKASRQTTTVDAPDKAVASTQPAAPPAAAAPSRDNLSTTIESLDAALFDAYNRCDLEKFAGFFTDDLEFYHDQTGLSRSLQSTVDALKKNICGKVRRDLVPGSLEVYPLKGYGAVEMGVHRFCDTKLPKCGEGSGEAKFIHLWQQKDNVWKITRVISYDHCSNCSPRK